MVQPTIVHARKPKRREKTQARTVPPIAAIVTATKPGPRRRAPGEIDPEVDAEVRAWVLKNMRPLAHER
jgi:hypothetical protein